MKNRLKELRARYGLGQEQLAEAVHCARPTISLIETERQQPGGELVVRLQDFFPGERIFFTSPVQISVHDYLAKRGSDNASHTTTP